MRHPSRRPTVPAQIAQSVGVVCRRGTAHCGAAGRPSRMNDGRRHKMLRGPHKSRRKPPRSCRVQRIWTMKIQKLYGVESGSQAEDTQKSWGYDLEGEVGRFQRYAERRCHPCARALRSAKDPNTWGQRASRSRLDLSHGWQFPSPQEWQGPPPDESRR